MSQDGDFELDLHRLNQRQKQIDFGKNTLGYTNYRDQVPLEKRITTGKDRHPVTPDVSQAISKRQFDGQVKAWRRALHFYDPSFSGQQAVPLASVQQQSPLPLSPLLQAQGAGSDHAGDKKRGFTRAFSGKAPQDSPVPITFKRERGAPHSHATPLDIPAAAAGADEPLRSHQAAACEETAPSAACPPPPPQAADEVTAAAGAMEDDPDDPFGEWVEVYDD